MTADKESEGWRPHVPGQDSATQRIICNRQRISLLTALNEVLKERRSVEHRRNTLLQAAALRQHQVQEMKTKCEGAWVEKIAEAQTLGRKFEGHCGGLRERRDALHKQLLTNLEGSVPKNSSHDVPSIRANYKMQAVQLQKDIADLKRRVSNARFRLDSEAKVRDTLQGEVKKLRNEAGAKKVHTATVRPQTLAMVSHPAQCRPAREQFRTQVLRNTTKRSPVGARSKAL